MSFHWPHVFWLLSLPVLLAVLELRRRASAQGGAHPKIPRAEAGPTDLQLIADPAARQPRPPGAGRVRWRLYVGLGLLITALARPQWGHIDEPVFDQAREIIVALDLSRSMLATDVRPSRLDRAKLLVTSLLERLTGERVGLIVFSGTAFLQSPLSSDYEILNEFLPALTPDYLPQGGSNYEALIETAISAFSSSGSADRFLIVLSDGEATDDRWKESLKTLQDKGIRVLGLGVGTPAGSILPDSKGGYIKDERGAVVLSKLEPATLQELANATKGAYLDASSWVDLSQLIQSTVEQGRKGQYREQRRARLNERFQWALGPALLFLLWSFYRELPVHPRAREVKLHPHPPTMPPSLPTTSNGAVAVVLGLALLLLGGPRGAAAESTAAAEPLSQLVAQYAARDTLAARDYAALAQATVTYGQRMQNAPQPASEGAIRDGLAAVDAGEALDPKAADWPALRKQLEEMLKKAEPPPQNEQQKEDQQNQDQQNQQDKSKQDQQNGKSDQQKKQNQQSQKEEQQKKQSSSSEKQNQDSEEQKRNSEDASEKNSPEPPQSSNPQSAFGDMDEKNEPPKTPPTPPPSPETQKIEPKENKDPAPNADPALVVPLQRLQQVRNQDDPIRLQKIMRGDKEAPAQSGKNW